MFQLTTYKTKHELLTVQCSSMKKAIHLYKQIYTSVNNYQIT